MLENLHLVNFNSDYQINVDSNKSFFIMKTCQRTLYLDLKEFFYDIPNSKNQLFKGLEAYHYLLQVICGVQSKVVAESEIVRQFKDAYQQYLKSKNRDPQIIRILEKLLKDAKYIRTEYLVGIGQKTYAAITRKIILNKSFPKRLLIIGTGNLSTDIINQMKKHANNIYISGRNKEKIQNICQKHMIFPLEWKDFDMYKEFSHIVNTIGVESFTFFSPSFFHQWKKIHKNNALFIDLGSPSIIQTNLCSDQGVIRLDDIYKESTIKEAEKIEKIKNAQNAIKVISTKRYHHMTGIRRTSFE